MNKLMNRLEALREQQVLHHIDLQLCRFLKEQDPEVSDPVLLASALVSYLYRQGDVCLLVEKYASQPIFDELEGDTGITAPSEKEWLEALSRSNIVGRPGEFKPLILDEGERLYLHKLWDYEHSLAEHIIKRSQQQLSDIDLGVLQDGLGRLFTTGEGAEVDWQKVAAATSVRYPFSVISGGPGTGKTSTVVRVLALLLEQAQDQQQKLNIALAAPTGKAAARLQDSISSALQTLDVDEEIRRAIPEETVTLHQLLGARRHTSSFIYNEENPLPYDVVVVDEASMVDQALMSHLMDALLDHTRLILLGDKDQLASVEAGSVLGDICSLDQNIFSAEASQWLADLSLAVPDANICDAQHSLADHITLLTKSYRFGSDSGISKLADAVNRGDSEEAVSILRSKKYKDASFAGIGSQADLEEMLRQKVVYHFKKIVQADSTAQALDVLADFRVLSPHRRGPWGVQSLNQFVEQILQQEGLIPKYEQWYPGKLIIVNVNDYTLGLHNGDTGLCLPNAEGKPTIYFRQEDRLRAIAPGRLPDHSRAFALTVHKSQGSEFEEVLCVLPDRPSKVLSRELIYTAITRSRTTITVTGKEAVLSKGIDKKLQRSSGLKKRLWKD